MCGTSNGPQLMSVTGHILLMSLFLSLSPSFEFHFKTLKERRTEKKERERVSTWRLLRGSFCGTTFYAHFTFILLSTTTTQYTKYVCHGMRFEMSIQMFRTLMNLQDNVSDLSNMLLQNIVSYRKNKILVQSFWGSLVNAFLFFFTRNLTIFKYRDLMWQQYMQA